MDAQRAIRTKIDDSTNESPLLYSIVLALAGPGLHQVQKCAAARRLRLPVHGHRLAHSLMASSESSPPGWTSRANSYSCNSVTPYSTCAPHHVERCHDQASADFSLQRGCPSHTVYKTRKARASKSMYSISAGLQTAGKQGSETQVGFSSIPKALHESTFHL